MLNNIMRAMEDIQKDIDKVKEQIFYEQMADFMDWGAYNKLRKKQKELEEELKAAKE